MNLPANSPENRLVFFDNLRFLIVLFVVLQHSGNAYSNLEWWPVVDNKTSMAVKWLNAFIDAFAMPVLFYIAGFFAVPVIKKKGPAAFLKGKLKRLGIPWLICIFTICPIVPLIYHYTRDGFTVLSSYWDLWVELMKNAAAFDIGFIVSMSGLMETNQFYQRYMWFISVLLLFFFIFSAIYGLKRNWFNSYDKPTVPASSSVLRTISILVAVGLLTFLGSSVIIQAMLSLVTNLSTPEPFFTLGNVVQFRPSRIFFFIVYFSFGILTFKYKWIERNKFPGHLPTWIISFVIIIIAFFYARNLMINGPEDIKQFLGPMVFWFFLNFLTISTLGLSTSLALKYWNLPTAINQNLATNSYNMFLAHYLFVLVFQLVLLDLPALPGLLKFGLTSVLSIIFAYIVCQFLLKPFPRISAVATFCLFTIMVLVIRT